VKVEAEVRVKVKAVVMAKVEMGMVTSGATHWRVPL
jgi:hypothetical protein